MKKQFNVRAIVFILLFVLVTSLPLVTFATGGSNDTPLRDSRPLKDKADDMFSGDNKNSSNAGLPDVSLDDASTWMERKGFEVIGFLQKFVQPFAIVIFILCGIMVLAGSFGNGRLVSRGLMGMFVSLIMYVVVLYAPEIMDVFLGWVQS